MLRKSVRKLLMLILAVIVGIMLLRWLQQQQPVASTPVGEAHAIAAR